MDIQEIPAIQTRYNGRLFRSRLEARWAVYFDSLGVRYEYEPETYKVGEYGLYLPDFYLPDLKVFVEIKPDLGVWSYSEQWQFKHNIVDADAFAKVSEFSKMHPTVIIFGTCFGKPSRILNDQWNQHVILSCENGMHALWICGGGEDFSNDDPYSSARRIALSERFENNRR